MTATKVTFFLLDHGSLCWILPKVFRFPQLSYAGKRYLIHPDLGNPYSCDGNYLWLTPSSLLLSIAPWGTQILQGSASDKSALTVKTFFLSPGRYQALQHAGVYGHKGCPTVSKVPQPCTISWWRETASCTIRWALGEGNASLVTFRSGGGGKSDLLNSVRATFNHVVHTTNSEAVIWAKQGILRNELVLAMSSAYVMRLPSIILCHGQLSFYILYGAWGLSFSVLFELRPALG